MESEVMRFVITQGIFAVMFVYLLFYVLRQNDKRELNYQEIIAELSRKFNIVEDVQKDVGEIKNHIFKE